jgi:hypothetical protein
VTIRTDNRLAEAPMTPVRCRRCAAEVQVRKSSWDQTSVQWSEAAVLTCWERADVMRLSQSGMRELFLACSALGETITDAVRQGQVPIVNGAVTATK